MFHLTKIFHFEAAHALMGYDGRCRNIHGHSYEMRVTIKGMPLMDENNPKYGMVMDFGDLIVHIFIHCGCSRIQCETYTTWPDGPYIHS